MMISNLIKIELAYINTAHPDFVGGTRAVREIQKQFLIKQEEDDEFQRNESLDSDEEATTLPRGRGGAATPLELPAPINEESAYVPAKGGDELNGDKGGLMSFIFGGKKEVRARQSMGGLGSPSNMVKLPQVPETMRGPGSAFEPDLKSSCETQIIKCLIGSYFDIVRKNFLDMVPKTIMYFLVNHARDSIQNELVSELYRENEISNLLKETDDIAQRRKTCVEMRNLLGRALEIVNEVWDFNTFK